MIFEQQPLQVFAAGYPVAPAALRHGLTGHSLLTLEALVDLTRILPAENVEYNAGDLPVGQDPAQTPRNGLNAEETVRRIRDCRSWLVLKNIEQSPDYHNLLESILGEVEAMIAPAHGPMHKREGFIFISSPNAVTPFHMDPEHNILLQIAGHKKLHLFPAHEGAIVTPEQHEAFHRDGGHRNLSYEEKFAPLGQPITLDPGDAVHIPLKAPHWVRVGDAVSISLSVTWRSRLSDAEARLHKANGWLRRAGFNPPPRGAAPLRDKVKSMTHRLVSAVKG